jgi:hypothetical protein
MTLPPSLSVVIPAYDAATWLPRTLDALRRAIAYAEWPDVEIVVVDDGSRDDTAAVLAADTGTPAVTVVAQPNAGRFLARRAGLRAARGELVLLLDSRVFPHEPSLRFLRDRLATHPDQRVWNGDVDVDTVGNPYAGFWAAVVTLAWRRWFTDRTEAAYGLDEFDHYPKGTGFFVAPRATLLRLVESFSATHDDWTLVSDDTHLLRGLAAEEPIRLSRQFCCTYHGREDLQGFLRQAYYRGTTFVDGHLRRESRFLPPFIALAALSPVAVTAALRRPRTVVAGALAGLAGLAGAARRCGANPAAAWPYGAGPQPGATPRRRPGRYSASAGGRSATPRCSTSPGSPASTDGSGRPRSVPEPPWSTSAGRP